MEFRKPNQKLEMQKAPKSDLQILSEKVDRLETKINSLIKLVKAKEKEKTE